MKKTIGKTFNVYPSIMATSDCFSVEFRIKISPSFIEFVSFNTYFDESASSYDKKKHELLLGSTFKPSDSTEKDSEQFLKLAGIELRGIKKGETYIEIMKASSAYDLSSNPIGTLIEQPPGLVIGLQKTILTILFE